MRDEAILCALNNVEWCDTVCRSHGLDTDRGREMWIQPRKGPPYYSNGITISRAASDDQYGAIENLKAALPDGFSIKDLFACLDLGSLGFRALFDAQWVWLDTASSGEAEPDEPEWLKVESERDLVRWEAAWAAAGSPRLQRVFMPTLLKEPRIAFFGVEHDGEIVAGCAANRSQGDVVGFSNFFAPAENRNRCRAEAVAKVMAFAPGFSVVGYERGDDLSEMLSLGFRSVGKLRVWLWL